LINQKLTENAKTNFVIIDNGSIDFSTREIEKKYPNFIYLYNKDNMGFSYAVNQGIKLVPETDFFCLVNNDAFVDPYMVDTLISSQKGVPGISGPVIFYKDKPDIVWQGSGVFSLLKMGVIVPEKNKRFFDKKIKNPDFISGCVMMIHKKVFDTVGYFDEKFFFYGEDLDFCLRAKKIGFQINYVPSAKAWHAISDIRVTRTNVFVLKNIAISYFLIVRKHYPCYFPYALLLFIFLYTPFRVYQILSGGSNISNTISWIRGGFIGCTKHL
jgi:GT2 family glycosyltransferase